jgi:hypothetical protein
MARKNKARSGNTTSPSSLSRNTRPKTSAKPWADGDLQPKYAARKNLTSTTAAVEKVPTRAPGETRTPPPTVPTSVPSNHPLLPPYADDVSLRNSHDLHVIPVASSSKIEAKVRAVLSVLNRAEVDGSKEKGYAADDGTRSVLVALVARAQAANKCISIAEIAKREFWKSQKKPWHQYTGYWVRLEDNTPEKKDSVMITSVENDAPDDADEENAFEKMPVEEARTVRNVPCLVIYLAISPVARLKELHG